MGFCRNFESKSDLPVGFYDQQDKIRDDLEKEFFAKFKDAKDHSDLNTWQSYKSFFFPADLMNSEKVIIELSSEILGDALIGLILSYIEKFSSNYCVIVEVFLGRNIKGKNYVGKFVVNLEEIVVEESLAKIWSKQVQFLAIEN